MDKTIEPYFTPEIIRQIARIYNTVPEKLEVLRDNINIVYGYKNNGKDYVLRVTHSSVQTKEVILSEMDWLHFLESKGVNVATPVPSENGSLAEVITSGDTYFTVARFPKAPGKKVSHFNWTAPVFKETGRVTGQMHRWTKDYIPSAGILKRHDCMDWDLGHTGKSFERSKDPILPFMNQMLDRLKNFTPGRDSYGFIHNDINRGNMFVENNKICLFDTADSGYTWFAADIALTLFYVVHYYLNNPSGSLQNHVRFFMDYYWEGYLSENKLADEDIGYIPTLMTLKTIFIYDQLTRLWDLSKINHAQKNFYDQIYSFSHESFDFLNPELIKP